MSQRPDVSVVVTAYNHASYLQDTLDSVFAQSYPASEVVLVDDGSTDNTPEIVARYGDRVRYIRQSNAGVAASRNTGVAAASGELIALLDGDDLWHPDKLKLQVEAFGRYPAAAMVVVDLDQFDPSGVIWKSALRDLRKELGPARAEVEYGSMYDDLLHGNWIATTSSVMIRSAALAEVGTSDSTFPVASDYDLYLRIAARYDVALVRTVLTYWRFLATSASGARNERSWRWGYDVVRVLAKHARMAGVDAPRVREALHRAVIRTMRGVYFREASIGRREALRELLALNRLAPSIKGFGYVLLTATPAPIRSVGSAAFRSLGRSISPA